MNASPATTIPVDKMYELLDKGTFDEVWMSVLKTVLVSSKAHQIAEVELFSPVPVLDENLLLGLTFNQVSILYEASLAYKDHHSRKSSGQYFTPDDVAQFMASFSVTDFEANKIWLDPCAGVGNLSYWLAKTQPDPAGFVLNQLKLADRDPMALLVATVLFTLEFGNGDVKFYEKMRSNVYCQDFLESPAPPHDYVIVNPPYAAVPVADARFVTAETKDSYAYFLEKIVLTSEGFISITPQSFTDGSKFGGLRGLLINHFNKVSLFVFDNMPDTIFRGVKFGSRNTNKNNSVRAAIMVAVKNRTRVDYKITAILRWFAGERAEAFQNFRNQLVPFTPSRTLFPKIGVGLGELYEGVKLLPALGDILCKTRTDYCLKVPGTPRYYISATKRSLDRSSVRELFFQTAEDRDYAYLLLNSSFTYWWWRVRDGGMTIALDTLKTLPMVPFEVDQGLIMLLEESEIVNLVTKLNSGRLNENVKHPKSLMEKINVLVTPRFVPPLIRTHNSSFLQK